MTDMTFEEMVDEAYKNLQLNDKPKLILPDISTTIETTRLIWTNVKELLDIIDRSPDHFLSWLESEIPDKKINWVSNDKSEGLIIHAKYRNNTEISKLFIKYVNTHVICICKSSNTTMTKEKFICNDCGATRYI